VYTKISYICRKKLPASGVLRAQTHWPRLCPWTPLSGGCTVPKPQHLPHAFYSPKPSGLDKTLQHDCNGEFRYDMGDIACVWRRDAKKEKYKQNVVGDGRRRPGAATWRTGWNIRIVLILTNSLYYVNTCRYPLNRKYITYRTAVRRGFSHNQGNMYGKFGEIWTCGFTDMRADSPKTDRQAHNHADCNTSHPAPLTRGKV